MTEGSVLEATDPIDAARHGDDPEPPPSRSRRNVPYRAIVGGLVAAAVAWYLFVLDTAADNNVIEGFGVLLRGLAELPALVADTSAYSSWWTWMSEAEGWGSILGNVIDHLQLVAMSMLWASILSICLGLLVHRVRALRGPILGVASIFLTIPSLALFAVFISVPIIGVGDRGPIIALVMYSVLPILRNTVIGLDEVDRAVIESAKGMGLNARQRLVRIELPLAWPIILTGIRVATLLNIGIAAIAPLVGGTGLGGYIRDGLQRYPDVTSVERMWTGVVFTVLLALAADLLFAVLRRSTTSKGLRS